MRQNFNKLTFFGLLFIALITVTSTIAATAGNKEVQPKPNGNKDSLKVEACNPWLYDTAGVYLDHWHTDRTFAYMDEKQRFFSDSTIVQLCSKNFDAVYPVENKVNSSFGYRHGRFHKGLDIDLERGDTVLAAFDGIVRYSQYNNGGFGNLIIIRHPNGLETYYAHLTKRYVNINDTIRAGQVIGTGGNTGARHSGPHLHFEVRIEDQPINPELIFDTENYTLKTNEITLEKTVFAPGHGTKGSSYNTIDKNATVYVVRSGDCLSKIAGRHGTSVSTLCRLNGLSTSSVLQIGQKIRVR